MKPVALDVAALSAWLDATLPDATGEAVVDQIEGGASNLIYKVERNGKCYALRRPPVVKNDPTSNNMRRELTLLKALGRSDIAHPRLVAACEDESVIGVPFALMEWVDGFTPKGTLPPGFETPTANRKMAEELIDALAKVSNADWKAMGLEGFGKPDNFLERQVDRWLSQLERARSRDLAHLDEVCTWLRAHTPRMQRASLMHGDYQFINVMFGRNLPPRLAAIVDWESATIGDPLLDLGWVLAGWHEEGEIDTHATYIDWRSFPPRVEMAERYAAKTALDVSALPFYMTLALFKLAVIMEGWYLRHLKGESKVEGHKAMETAVPGMLKRAAWFAHIL